MSGIILPDGTFWWTGRPHDIACKNKSAPTKIEGCPTFCRYGDPWPTLRMLGNPQEKKASQPPLGRFSG